MTLTRLSDRLEKVPLVLTGPLLRRTEPTGVTVSTNRGYFLAIRRAEDGHVAQTCGNGRPGQRTDSASVHEWHEYVVRVHQRR